MIYDDSDTDAGIVYWTHQIDEWKPLVAEHTYIAKPAFVVRVDGDGSWCYCDGKYRAKFCYWEAWGRYWVYNAIESGIVYIDTRGPDTASTPSGPTTGYVNTAYSYSTSTTDPDGDNVRYGFIWGDGLTTTTDWYASGDTATASHSWTSVGTYNVKVDAQDYSSGLWSSYSPPLTVIVSENGLVGYWRFNEGSGSSAGDSSGLGNTGTIYDATWTTGKLGYGLSFDGVDDYVEVPDSPSLRITGAVTVAAWVKTAGESVDHDQWITAKKYHSWSEGGYALFWGWGNDLYFSIGSYSTGQHVMCIVPSPWNVWNFWSIKSKI